MIKQRGLKDGQYMFALLFETYGISFTEIVAKFFVPGYSITVDKQSVSFRGRCKLIQCMSSKLDKYGIQITLACENNLAVPGQQKDVSSIAANLALTLTNDFQGTGRNVICDN